MSEPKPFASLSASLLARKGAARPAMRSALDAPAVSAVPAPAERHAEAPEAVVADIHNALADHWPSEADAVPAPLDADHPGDHSDDHSAWHDCGWNDMGESAPSAGPCVSSHARKPGIGESVANSLML